MMLLTVENLRVSYGRIRALHGISFEIDKGEIVTIIGANGAGKSTTLRAVSNMIPVEQGSKITFDGQDLLKYPPDKVVSQLGVSHVPEGRRIFGNLTVLENMQLAAFARKDKAAVEHDIKRMFEVFTRLEERKVQKAGTLSGGEQQMLAISRAFISARKFMILDEPSMGLSPLLMQRVFESLREINNEGTTILLVEQNARAALKFAKRAYVLEAGEVVAQGKSEDLMNDPEVMKAYLGV